MKKTMMLAALSLSMAFALTACGGEETDPKDSTPKETSIEIPDPSTETIVGGWTINQGSLDPKENPDAVKTFERATEDLTGYTYEAISILGSQTVSGMNYSYLCKGQAVTPEATPEYVIVNVYEDLQGNAEVIGTKELLEVQKEMPGGWHYNEGESELKDEAAEAFTRALDGFVGVSYVPIAYIGSQTVAGTNYAVFCSAKQAIPNPERYFRMLIIHDGADGKATLGEVKDVDIATDLVE